MAKCSICNSRKGKRKCLDTDTFICSLCCGTSRHESKCIGCLYYKYESSNRNYRKVPHFTIQDLKNDFNLQNISELIERGLCIIDEEDDINDSHAARILELLLDKYYFKDEPAVFKNEFEKDRFFFIDRHIEDNFPDTQKDVIYKVLSSILRSINRHTNGKREYLDFVYQFMSL